MPVPTAHPTTDMTEDLDRFWRDQQRQNNDAAAREARERHARQQAEQHERMMDRQRRDADRAGPLVVDAGGAGGTDPVAVCFGLIGALFGGVLQPFGMGWFFGGFLGFVVVGIAAGILRAFRIGRAILWIVALGFMGLVVAAIVQAEMG